MNKPTDKTVMEINEQSYLPRVNPYLGGENPQMSRFIHGETAQKWTNKGHHAGLDHVCRDYQVCHNPKDCI